MPAAVELLMRVVLENHQGVHETHIDRFNGIRQFVGGSKRPPRGTLLVMHGVNPRGAWDPRLEGVAKAFAAIGFRVLMPNIASLQRLEVGLRGVEEMEAVVDALTEVVGDAGDQTLSVFGASLSGAMALVAASRPRMQHRVRAICVVGGFASTSTVSRKIMLMPPGSDDYGRNVLFYNFVEMALGPNEALKKALYHAVLDNHLLRRGTPDEQLPRYLAQVPPQVGALYWRLQNDVAFRLEIAEQVTAQTAELMRALSPVEFLRTLRCQKVVLVHGQADEVVPSCEAELLYEEMRKVGIDAELCKTHLLGHGDKMLPRQPLHRIAADAFQLVAAWASFIEAATVPVAPATPARVLEKAR